MKSPLERAARALCTLEGKHPDLSKDGKPYWRVYVPAVQVMLAEIRSPNEALMSAMEKTVPADGGDWEFARWMARDHWHAMVDALLRDEP